MNEQELYIERAVDGIVRDISELLRLRLLPTYAPYVANNRVDLETALTRLQLLCSHIRVMEEVNG